MSANILPVILQSQVEAECFIHAHLHWLEAELCSFEKNLAGAETSYASAIEAAASSGFIHEKGLSCELAGLHYEKIGRLPTALDFFRQARDCYEEWGSQLKVKSISQQIEKIDGLQQADLLVG